MAKKMYSIKNFIFLVVFLAAVCFAGLDAFKAYADEDNIDYTRYYYLQLSDEAKLIYDALYDNVEATKAGDFEITKEITKDTFNKLQAEGNSIVQSAMDAFDRDHPEVFWLDISKIQMKFKSNMIIFEPVNVDGKQNSLIDVYSLSEEGYEEFENDYIEMGNILEDIEIQSTGMTQFEQVKYIHDYLVVHNEYNNDIPTASDKAYKAISALIGNKDNEHAPLCEGYSRAFKVICDRLDIPCVIVSGEALINEEHLGHMWNYVKLDGKWYAMDVTWDDPVLISGSYEDLSEEKKYEYFLIGKEKEELTHFPINVFTQKEGYTIGFIYPSLYPLNYGDLTPLYSVSITRYSNGTITTDLDNLEFIRPGTKVNLTVTVKDGMKLIEDSLKVNGNPLEDMSFIMPNEDVVITAAFMTDIKEDNSVKDEETDKENESDDEKEPSKPTQIPDNDEESDKNTEENKKPIVTEKPNEKPVDTSKPDADDELSDNDTGTNKEPNIPQNTAKPSDSENSDDKQEENNKKPEEDKESDIIIVEDNFEETNPLANIKIINKATISVSNKDVVYSYRPFLNDKNITFYIGNGRLSPEQTLDIVSKEYLVKQDSEVFTLQVLVYDNDTNKLVNYITSDNPVTIFLPVDASWVSEDYDEFFYMIENDTPQKKTIMVRRSYGQYYLQLTLEDSKSEYAIIRRRSDGYVIPGTTTNNYLTLDDDTNKNNIIGIKEVVLIGLAVVAVLLTIRIVILQHKYKKVDKEE